ncbi:hypothetical protein K438DRAFT_1939312 [Mycena galopus ATCC 62051]|nr:hypothetical protein K438DRAFT_1939312 [Mycena galopus ATCC 62051]
MPTHDIEEHNEDTDHEPALRPIDNNISRDEALEQLKLNQLYTMRLLDELRQLRKENSSLRAAAPKKRRGQTDDVLGYKRPIVGIAKSVLFTRAFILDRNAFTGEKPNLPTNPLDQFTSDAAYTASTAIALYEEIPAKFYSLIDPKVEPNFSNDFIREHSDGRSTFLNALRKAMPAILTDVDVSSDLLVTAKADRSKDHVLLNLLKFPNERKPSRFPPIFFPGSSQNMKEVFTGPYFLKTHRLMFFGPGSLVPNSKPAANSNGIKLGFKAITSSSMAATAISLRFVLSADKEWNSKGAVTGINWESEYRAYLELLKSSRKDKTHIKTILKTVHNFVFAGVDTTAIQADPNEDADDADELNELMRRFELGADSFDNDAADLVPGPVLSAPSSPLASSAPSPRSPVTSSPPSPVTSLPPSPVTSVPPPCITPPPPITGSAGTQDVLGEPRRTRGKARKTVVESSEEEEVVASGSKGGKATTRGKKTTRASKRK